MLSEFSARMKRHSSTPRKKEKRQAREHLPDAPGLLSPAKIESRKEDTRLIASALRGEQSAFKLLMKKYHDQISNLIFRIIHQQNHVEDLTQEVFIKAFGSLRSFNNEFAFSTWLYKIATNSSIDFIRKRKLNTFSIDKPVPMEESDYTFELPDTSNEPDRDIIQRQRAKLLEQAINRLPEKYKRVIILRHTEERDYSEIAKILKLPIGTVKAHIFRARELLNKYLRDRIAHY